MNEQRASTPSTPSDTDSCINYKLPNGKILAYTKRQYNEDADRDSDDSYPPSDPELYEWSETDSDNEVDAAAEIFPASQLIPQIDNLQNATDMDLENLVFDLIEADTQAIG